MTATGNTGEAAVADHRAFEFWPALRSYLGRHRGQVAIVGVLLVGEVVAELLKPWPMKFVIDYLTGIEGGDPSARVPVPGIAGSSVVSFLVFSATTILGFALFDAIVSYLGTVWRNRLGSQIGVDVRRTAFAKLQRLGLDYHHTQRSGELTTRVVSDTNQLESFVSDSAPSLVQVSATFVSMIAIMFWLDWRLALVTTAIIPPVMFVVIVKFVEAIKERSRTERAETGALTALTQETLQSIQVVKVFSREDFTDDLFDTQNRSTRNAKLATVAVEGKFTPTIKTMVQVGVVVMLVFGVLRVRANAMSTGDLWIFLAYFRGIKGPLKELSSGLRQLARTQVRWDRISEILALGAAEHNPSQVPAPLFEGRVELKGVHFSYKTADGGSEQILKGVNLHVSPGERMAIVGQTGAGKSTLVSLIAALYEPSAGTVEIDGNDLSDLQSHTVRQQIAFVLQESLLFATTIGQNIGYGRLDATPDEIVAAAKQARIHDFIVGLPDGYGTMVGERGTTMSGGQRQRMAIARAILRDAKILILDEPVTGLDTQTQNEVWSEIEQLMVGKTTILITHDEALATGMDRVFHLSDGRAVDLHAGSMASPTVACGVALTLRTDKAEKLLPEFDRLGHMPIVLPHLRRTVQPQLFEGWEIASARICSVKNRTYGGEKRPKSSALLHYELSLKSVDGQRSTVVGLYLKAFLNGRGTHTETANRKLVASIPELDAYAWIFPGDPEMKCLATLANPATVENQLPLPQLDRIRDQQGEVDRIEIACLRYKPEDRCTLRMVIHRRDGASQAIIAKIFSSSDRATELFEATVALRRASQRWGASFIIPEPVALDRERATLWISELPGRSPTRDSLDEDTVARIAAALASFHGAAAVVEGPGRTSLDQLTETIERARILTDQFPTLGPRLVTLVDRLEAEADGLDPFTPGNIHGAFRMRQLLVDGSNIGLIDFDSLAQGDPMEDVVDMMLDLSGPADEPSRAPLAARFLAEYEATNGALDQRRLQWQTPIQMLKRAHWLRHAALRQQHVAEQLTRRVDRACDLAEAATSEVGT